MAANVNPVNNDSNISVNTESCKLWNPYKELYNVVQNAIIRMEPDAQADFERILKKNQKDFLSLLENTPKNPHHRKLIEGSSINIIGRARHVASHTLDKATIDETLILSDLFDINEIEALELLLAGESQMSVYPGLSRGLIAVLLYHDGRRCLVTALRTLVQSGKGRSFMSPLSEDLRTLVTEYTDQLAKDGLLSKVLGQMSKQNVKMTVDKMTEQRALGKAKHRHEVISLIKETHQGLADIVFYWSCQRPFTRAETLQVLSWLKNVELKDECTLDGVVLSVLMAFVYAIDSSLLEIYEDADEMVTGLPMISDDGFISSLHSQIKLEASNWKCQGLCSFVRLCWALSLRVVSQYPSLPPAAVQICEEDEDLVDSAISDKVFEFMLKRIVKSEHFTSEEEFYMRRIHGILSTFIMQMPFKIKELRDIGDDSARIIAAHQQEGLDLPKNLRYDFQNLLELIGAVYQKEKNQYSLAADYWCLSRPPPQRQISLHKFIKIAGGVVPPPLFVPYVNMLAGLSSNEVCALSCFNMLKSNGEQASTVSWDHIFSSIYQYFTSLRHEATNQETGHGYMTRGYMMRDITEQELSGLVAVCRLISQVCSVSSTVCCTMVESQQWIPTIVMFGLVGCGVPIKLKAELLLALAAMARNSEVASNIWQTLEMSQLLTTTGGYGSKPSGGLVTELEEVETRSETYPMLISFLTLIDNLLTLTGQPPDNLGAGMRAPGFHPYLNFILNNVVLKLESRSYKSPQEKWHIASVSLSIMNYLLSSYEPEIDDFDDRQMELSSGAVVLEYKPAGYTLLIQLLQSSPLLKSLLHLVIDGLESLMQYDVTSACRPYIEKTTLAALQLVNTAINKQDCFTELIRLSGHSAIVCRLEKLLMGINPMTGQADYILNIARYSSLVNMLPAHSLHAICILASICAQAGVNHSHLVSLILTDDTISQEILAGFVEGLEQGGENVQSNQGEDGIRHNAAVATLRLLLSLMSQSSPNFAHFLLGFNVNRPLAQNDLDMPGFSETQKTCLHATLSLVQMDFCHPIVAELSYQLIFCLCSHVDTCLPVLRYLRTSQDFFYKNIMKLPFSMKASDTENAAVIPSLLRQQAWFMKCLAIELRVTSLNKHQSHTQRLTQALLDSNSLSSALNSTVMAARSAHDVIAVEFSKSALNVTTLADLSTQKGYLSRQSRLLHVLDLISFDSVTLDDIRLEHFNTSSVMQALRACEERLQDESGPFSINVPKVHRLLMGEINLSLQQMSSNIGGPGAMSGSDAHRDILLREVKEILQYAANYNNVREEIHTRVMAFDSWRQVTEVILTGSAEDTPDLEKHHTIINLLNTTSRKCLQEGSLDDLVSPACGVILSLMASLRQSLFAKSVLDSSLSSSLIQLLKGIINLVVATSGSLQRARANLYGSLLYYLQITESSPTRNTDLFDDRGVAKAVMIGSESNTDKLRRESLSVINSFGDSLLEMICRDACDGLNVNRMLALSCLDSITNMDPMSHNVLRFMSTHGYLRHILNSLVQSDSLLIESLDPTQPLRHIYIYESTMAFLTRLAMTAQGAHALLNAGVMEHLSNCMIYSSRPSSLIHNYGNDRRSRVEHLEGFLPSSAIRYKQILLPCLRLCLSILVSLGMENQHAADQKILLECLNVRSFIRSSSLDDKMETVESMQELSLLLAVVSRAAAHCTDNATDDERALLYKSQISRIQRQMGSLFAKYSVLDDWAKRFKTADCINDIQQRQLLVSTYEVCANTTSYCRYVLGSASSDSDYCKVLFAPTLTEVPGTAGVQTGSHMEYSHISDTSPPGLGLVIVQLKKSCHQMLDALDEHKRLTTLLSGAGVSSQKHKVPADNETADQDTHVGEELEGQTHIIHLLAVVIESCLYILWKHLDFYLVSCIPEDRQLSLFKTHKNSQGSMRKLTENAQPSTLVRDNQMNSFVSVGVSHEQLNSLRETIPKIITESLLQKLNDIEQCYSSKRSHYSYIGALNRRLKRLVNIYCM